MFSQQIAPNVSSEYSFSSQENDYSRFRPKWPVVFALAAIAKAELVITDNPPVIICIGSGTGADAEPFLSLGCDVYCVEPNQKLRQIAETNFLHKYPQHFHSIDGTAHQFKLPEGTKADLLICAQSLHTFSSKVNKTAYSESMARQHWHKFLRDNNKDCVSIWYYNLDPSDPKVVQLHQLMMKHSKPYATSKTSFFDAALFEPAEFQYFIDPSKMEVSASHMVERKLFDYNSLIKWLASYSFSSNTNLEENDISQALRIWFEENKNSNGKIELTFYGFITQGPLRTTPLINPVNANSAPISPISSKALLKVNPSHPSSLWPKTKPDLRVANFN